MADNNIAALAEAATLRQEIAYLEELVPQHVPFTGTLPATLADFEELPEPWRRQIAVEHSEHLQDLVNKNQIQLELDAHDRREARRLEILKDLPVKTTDEFDALPPAEREDLAFSMTSEQQSALSGALPPDPNEGWL